MALTFIHTDESSLRQVNGTLIMEAFRSTSGTKTEKSTMHMCVMRKEVAKSNKVTEFQTRIRLASSALP